MLKLFRHWSSAAEEMVFLGRAGDVGDDLGSRLIAARMAEHAMRLCFLNDRYYAPYAKWLGSAFRQLPSAANVARPLRACLAAGDWREREEAIGAAFLAIARKHMEAGIVDGLEPALGAYFSRPYTVINAGEIAAAFRLAIVDPMIRDLATMKDRNP